MARETMKDAAHALARRNMAIFPLVAREKVPAIEGGFTNASMHPEDIDYAWGINPDYNLAIATGEMSYGIVVIDIDYHPERGVDGYETLREWERAHGELPETVMASTPTGGTHYYYRADRPIKCSTNEEAGIDIRGDGGYVVAPPSIHPVTGTAYEWENHPDDYEIAKADENVYEFIRSVHKGASARKFELPDEIPIGKRDDTLFRLACSLQEYGQDDDVIYAFVETVNNERCNPPMSKSEVRKCVESALRYRKGAPKGALPKADVALMCNSKGVPHQTIENVIRVLANDPALAGRFYYDERAYTRMVTLPLPWDDREGTRAISDSDYCCLAAYLEREHGLTQKVKAIDAVTAVSVNNRRNVIAEWLDSLEWDGVERMNWLATVYLGCEPNDYNVAVMRLFMAGAVARAYEPGTKFDYMPVLIGRQGIGKSMFVRRLCHRSEWYCDNLNTIEGDAAAEKLRGMWIAEMAELLATKRQKDVESIKAFITSQVDTIRPKYARETEQRPRACVFVGTTNNPSFLTDFTGNRRFLPMECGAVEIAGDLFADDVEEYFAQAWAEAVHVYKTEQPRLVLEDRLAEYASDAQERYLEDDPRIGMIQEYLDEKLADTAQPESVRVCVTELIECAIGIPNTGAHSRFLINEIHAIMRNRMGGWMPSPTKKKCGKYGIQRCYVPMPSE